MTAIMLALLAAVGYGVSDFVGGVAARRVAALRIVIVSYPLSVLLVLAFVPLAGGHPDIVSTAWSLASGVASGLAVWWFYLALAAGPMSVVSPLTAVLVAGIPVLVGVAAGERPDPLAYAGIALALLAVVLVSRESPAEISAAQITGDRPLRFDRKVALLTAGSGIAFGLTFVFLHEPSSDAGLWPVILSRCAATVTVWCVALTTGRFRPPQGRPLGLAVAVSALDAVANVAILYALRGSLLSLVSVIGSLYPAATVLLATMLLGERVNITQRVGMLLAVTAVILIALA